MSYIGKVFKNNNKISFMKGLLMKISAKYKIYDQADSHWSRFPAILIKYQIQGSNKKYKINCVIDYDFLIEFPLDYAGIASGEDMSYKDRLEKAYKIISTVGIEAIVIMYIQKDLEEQVSNETTKNKEKALLNSLITNGWKTVEFDIESK